MSPILKKVENAGIKGIKQKRKPYQIVADDFFRDSDTIRLLFSQLIDTPNKNRAVLIPSISYGIACVTRNLPFTDGEIILANEQFPSNYYPWKRLEESGFTINVVHAPDSQSRSQEWNARILESINEKTRVVSIGHVHWSDGTLFQLEKIRKKLDEVGGLLVIDGTQSVGALPFSVQEIRPDALVCAGYKWLMGPYSLGLAYFGPAFDSGVPLEENWINRMHSEEFSGLVNYEPNYREDALRYEVGEHSNFILVPMLLQALKQILKWSPENIQSYCQQLTQEPFNELKSLGFRIEERDGRAEHLIGIRPPESLELAELQKSFKKHKVSVSMRGDAVRISPHLYNDEIDMRKLLKAMKEPIFAQKN